MFEQHGTEHPRVNNRLTRAIRSGRIHRVRCVAHQRYSPFHPGVDGVSVNHGVLKDAWRLTNERWHIEPGVLPILKVSKHDVRVDRPIPVCFAPLVFVRDRNLCDPVQFDEPGCWVGCDMG